jgi:molecular chaperone Hsp33
VLQRICRERDCRLFAGEPVRFACRCSEGRVAGLLRSLGAAEMRSILAEQGAVTVTCEFCGRPYRFDAIDVETLFTDAANPEAPHSIN